MTNPYDHRWTRASVIAAAVPDAPCMYIIERVKTIPPITEDDYKRQDRLNMVEVLVRFRQLKTGKLGFVRISISKKLPNVLGIVREIAQERVVRWARQADASEQNRRQRL